MLHIHTWSKCKTFSKMHRKFLQCITWKGEKKASYEPMWKIRKNFTKHLIHLKSHTKKSAKRNSEKETHKTKKTEYCDKFAKEI